jgi:hypothetical protein
MIVQRIAHALKTQDWSTITIELLVVVVGIILGLQVDDWNEARKKDAQERVYLERLLSDLDEMIAQHAAHEEEANAKLNSIYVTFDALRSCELAPDDVTPFENTLLNHQGLERLKVIRSSYDEMVASGVLARIDDPMLKRKISEIYSEAAAAQQFIEYFTADLGRASDIIWRHVSFDLKPGTASRSADWAAWEGEEYAVSVAYDFAGLCNAPTFKNAMVEVFDSTKDRLGVGARFAQQLGTLRGLIADRLQMKD